jgi:hypothetical protein
MRSRQIALLCSVAILGSLFLPWVVSPIGNNLVPWTILPPFERVAVEDFLRSATPEVLVFLAAFPLALMFLLLSLVGQDSRLLALLTGAGPVGLAGLAIWRERERLGLAEVTLTMEEASLRLTQASEVLGPGGWAWIGGAALLLLLALFDPGRPKPRPITGSNW